MLARPITLVLLACSLAACKSDTPAEEEDPVAALQAGNTMSCVGGAEKFSGKGEQVGVGSLGGNGKQLSLTLQLMVERDGKNHIISSGLLAVPMAEGTTYFPALDKEGGSGGTYDIKTLEMDPVKDFSGSAYGMVYSDKQFDNEAKLKLEIRKFAQSVAPETKLPRYHIQGAFQFNAAYMPHENGNLPEACSMEAIERSMKAIHGEAPRYPMYDAGVCKAEKKRFDCTFDVTFDGLPV